MEAKDDKLFSALFNQLIVSLSEAAMMQLGKIANPVTGISERNLAAARNTIDVLRTLSEKTKNNLSEAESRLLEQAILTLQMNYVLEADPSAKPAKPPESKPEIASGGELPAGDQVNPDTPPGSRPGENN